MTPRTIRWLLLPAPRAWRNRYGAEIEILTGELIRAGDTKPGRAAANLFATAAAERGRALRQPAVLVPVTGTIAAAAGITLAVTRLPQHGGAMQPYFATPVAGAVLLLVALGWSLLELLEYLQVQQRRPGATRPRTPRSYRLAAAVCVLGMYVWLYLAPPIVPRATIRPEATAFVIGMIVLLAGIALRVWSFFALGRYFTHSVQVSAGQPVVSHGPYRLVRHPGYAGGLLAWIGIGLTSANWAGLAAVTLLPLIIVSWRIRLEEDALLATLDDDRYRRYAAQHKRLIPRVW